MNEVVERIRQYGRRRVAYEKAYTQGLVCTLPTQSMRWIVQVDGTYLDRFAAVLSRIQSANMVDDERDFFAVCPAAAENGAAQGHRHFEVKAALCFMEQNVILKGWLPSEFVKHIHKIMYCDRVCSDLETLVRNINDVLAGIKGTKLIKTLCSPKSLEESLVRILADDLHEDCQFTASESKYTLLLDVVYCPLTGNFHYGLVNRDTAERSSLTSQALEKIKKSGGRSLNDEGGVGEGEGRGKLRPCRAYYKMSEVVESVLPSLGWELRDLSSSDALAMDVGASPGGWSQYLAEAGFSKVLAVDPGELQDSVLKDSRICHLQCLVEDPLVGTTLGELVKDPATPYKSLRIIVCDVNFAPWLAAKTLAKYCFPWLEGFGVCTCSNLSPSSSSSSGSSHEVPAPQPAFVVLTLKMMKHPKEHHIQRATEECKAIMVSAHQDKAKLSCACPCSCWSFSLLHLAANSANERTLVCKLH